MSDRRTPLATWGIEPAAPGARATRLELFYDLVFVYAFINVTTATAKDLGGAALLRGLLMLALLWFAWSTFAAVGNTVRADHGILPLVGFGSMAAIFVAALTIPYAFADPPNVPGDLIFAFCYLLVRELQVLAYWYAVRRLPHARLRWLPLAGPPLATTTFLVLAALVPQRILRGDAEFAARVALWTMAIAVAYGVAALTRTSGVPIISARHWAERYAQIVLIALGESIISLGTGPGLPVGLPLTWPVIGTAVLGIAIIAGFWWAYFDTRAIAGEHALRHSTGAARTALARDAYTYLHLPMIIGILLFSLGLKQTLGDIADPAMPETRPLHNIEVLALYGGTLTYGMALLAFQLRTHQGTDWFQVTIRLVLLGLIPVALRIPATAALALLVVVTIGPIMINHVRGRNRRERLRTSALAEERAIETTETQWGTGRQ